jgi:hypothetical protein
LDSSCLPALLRLTTAVNNLTVRVLAGDEGACETVDALDKVLEGSRSA